MKDTRNHEIRTLLLVAIVTVWTVASSVGFVGSVAAQSNYDLEASDGASGDESRFLANVDDQLPEGNQSGDDTLRVEATNETLPKQFRGELTLPGSSDLTFNSSQNPSDVELVVIGDDGTAATADGNADIEVTSISNRQVEFEVNFEGKSPLGADPVAVEISNLTFDAGSTETVTLEWYIPYEKTQYDLVVEDRDLDLAATDENGGDTAQLTAGANDQPMAGGQGQVDTEPARNLVLQGDEEEFPSAFEASVVVGNDDITFNDSLSRSDVSASSSNDNADVNVTRVDSDEITVSVSNFEGSAEDAVIVELSGVTFDVPADSTGDTLEWQTLGQRDSYALEAEYLAASFDQGTYEITRGRDGEPSGGAAVTIGAGDRATDGFHGQDRELHVQIPSEHRDDLQFANASQPEATMFTTDDVDVEVENAYRLTLTNFPDDVDSGDSVTVSNITFNTTGYTPADGGSPSFESGLDLEYEPVDNGGQDRVSIATDSEALAVQVPEISFENGAPTSLEPGASSTGGDTAIEVNITDTSGGQMASGTEIVIGLENANGLTFDTSQEDQLRVRGASFATATDVSVYEQTIVIEMPSFASSQEGESVILEHEDGNGIRFDASEATEARVPLRVRTNAGDAGVTQETGTAVVVGDPGPTETPSGGDGDGDTSGGDSGSDGGTGGTGGSGTSSAGDADFQVTSTSVNRTEIDVDEAVAVTATVENTGDADGEFTVRLTADGFTLTSETVAVPQGETREVTLVHVFSRHGTYDLAINEEVPVGTLQVGPEGPTVDASETATLEDGEAGPEVTFQDVPVRSIAFSSGSATGEVTVEQLSGVPEDAAEPDGAVFEVVRISVPDAHADVAARLEIAVSTDDLEAADVQPGDLTVVHYDESAGTWTALDTQVVESGDDEVVLAAETPGFSTFAVTSQEAESTPTPTDGTTTDDSTPTTDAPPEQQSGIPNPLLWGGALLALVLVSFGGFIWTRMNRDGGL